MKNKAPKLESNTRHTVERQHMVAHHDVHTNRRREMYHPTTAAVMPGMMSPVAEKKTEKKARSTMGRRQ